jgi:hypothetical protein
LGTKRAAAATQLGYKESLDHDSEIGLPPHDFGRRRIFA